MVAFTEKICERETRIHFTNGELIGDMNSFTTTNFSQLDILGKDERESGKVSRPAKVHHQPTTDVLSGHGGGDMGLIATFIEAVHEGRQELLGITVDDVLNSHLTVSLILDHSVAEQLTYHGV